MYYQDIVIADGLTKLLVYRAPDHGTEVYLAFSLHLLLQLQGLGNMLTPRIPVGLLQGIGGHVFQNDAARLIWHRVVHK